MNLQHYHHFLASPALASVSIAFCGSTYSLLAIDSKQELLGICFWDLLSGAMNIKATSPFFLSRGIFFGHPCSSASGGLTPADPSQPCRILDPSLVHWPRHHERQSPAWSDMRRAIPNVLVQSYLHLPGNSVHGACVAASPMEWRRMGRRAKASHLSQQVTFGATGWRIARRKRITCRSIHPQPSLTC